MTFNRQQKKRIQHNLLFKNVNDSKDKKNDQRVCISE